MSHFTLMLKLGDEVGKLGKELANRNRELAQQLFQRGMSFERDWIKYSERRLRIGGAEALLDCPLSDHQKPLSNPTWTGSAISFRRS